MDTPPQRLSKTSVIISLHNYEDHIAACLESVLKQSRSANEIIVVDDGSTDRSSEIVEGLLDANPELKLIQQENQGQLAAFQTGIEHSESEIIFFLDADDLWTPEHLERSCQIFEKMPEVDFVYTGYQEFGRSTRRVRPHSEDMFLGRSILGTRYNRNYIGSITSTNAIRRELVNRIFPVPLEVIEQGRINADAYLVFGSSLAGGTKYYRKDLTVEYRIHERNNYQGRDYTNAERYGQVVEQWQTIEYLWKRLKLPDSLSTELAREFKTIPEPDRKSYKRAIQTLRRLSLSTVLRLKCRLELLRHYYKI